MRRIIALVACWLLLAVPASAQTVIGSNVYGGSGVANPNFPTILQGLQAWYSADQGTYQDAACQFTAEDKSWHQKDYAEADPTPGDPTGANRIEEGD